MKKLLIPCLLLTSCAGAPSGRLLGAPVALTSSLDPTIRVKHPGFDTGVPPASLLLPPFDRIPSDLLAAGGFKEPPAESPILAMSLGLEVIFARQIDVNGDLLDGVKRTSTTPVAVLDVGQHGWTALGFTVNEAEVGSGPLAPDVALAQKAGELDRTVFGYALPGSAGEWVPGEDKSVRAIGPGTMLLVADDHILGLDMHAAFYLSDLAAYAQFFTTRHLPADVWVYFTLTPEFVAAHGSTFAAAWGITVDTKTIYRTHWVDPTWTPPAVYRTWVQLGNEPAQAGSDPVIDGLSMDVRHHGGDPEGDEILFSLAAAPGYPTSAADQVLYTRIPPAGRPRRVVVRETTGGYGSLGLHMGAGDGLGDFCTADPFGDERSDWSKPLLDDFMIARRLDALPHAQSPVAPPSIALPGGAASAAAVLRSLPTLALASSGYRVFDGVRACMRSCMSWPLGGGEHGKATVRWGRILDLQKPPGHPGNLVWEGSLTLAYLGTPLTFDRPLPANGMLRKGPPPDAVEHVPAFVMQWFLNAGDEYYRSPISALRY